MKPRDIALAGTAAGMVLGGLGWLIAHKMTEVGPVEPVRLGEAMPTLEGVTLSGERLKVPDDLAGRVSVLMLADSYDARYEVAEWTAYVRTKYGDRPGMTFYQVPLITVGPLLRRAIDLAMQRGTPASEHSHVLTVYGDVRVQRKRLGMTGQPYAYVVLLGRTGRIAWRAHGKMTDILRAELDDALIAQGIESNEG